MFAEKDNVSLYQKQAIDSLQIPYLKLMKEVDGTSYILTGTEHLRVMSQSQKISGKNESLVKPLFLVAFLLILVERRQLLQEALNVSIMKTVR